jgi:orotidine-5'-phosphate decarboxylase
MRRGERGVLVICKTSNPGSGDLQDRHLDADGISEPMYLTVADRVAAWSERWPATLGLVVGATYPSELAAVRLRCPHLPILLPGIGEQGGDLEASIRAGVDSSGGGMLVSASRSVLYADPAQHPDWTAAVRAEAVRLRDAINTVRTVLA